MSKLLILVIIMIVCMGCKPTCNKDAVMLSLPLHTSVHGRHGDKEIIMGRFEDVIARSEQESVLTWKPPIPTTEAEVNKRINKIPYSDKDVHGNHWKTPQEIMKQGYTDCVGYAMTKYIALKQMGYDKSRLKMVVVYVPSMKQYHAILVIDDSRVMNCLEKTIKPLSFYKHKYKKLYWVNETGFGVY